MTEFICKDCQGKQYTSAAEEKKDERCIHCDGSDVEVLPNRSCHDCKNHYFDMFGNICKLDEGADIKSFDPGERAQDCQDFTQRKLEACPACGILTELLYDGLCALCLDDGEGE